MKFSVILLGAALCLLSSTEAGIATTSPFKSVTWNGGDIVQVTWDEDGTPPKLEEIGITSVDLMAGGDSVQTLVANIGQTQGFAKEIGYTVPKNLGPPGDFYFIKYTAGAYTSYSGTFSIAGIDGEIGGFDPKNPNGKNSTSTTPATPATPTGPNTDPAAASGTAVKSPLPSSLSGNAANLLPSFAGIATAAIALTLTYFY